jgi:hypothetical protein
MDELLTQTSLSPAKILTDIVCYDSRESFGESVAGLVAGNRQVLKSVTVVLEAHESVKVCRFYSEMT